MTRDLGSFDAERAKDYVRRAHLFIPAYEDLHRLTRVVLDPLLPPQARILVVGIGTGKELGALLGPDNQWTLTGVDPSAAMLEYAGKEAESLGLTQRVKLAQGDLKNLHRGQPYHAATALLVWHFIPDNGEKLAFLQEISARLKPGGTLVLVNLFREQGDPDEDLKYQAWGQYAVKKGWGSPEEVAEKMADRKGKLQLVSQARQQELLTQAGFKPPRLFFQALHFGGWLAEKI
ncbi:MAG: class I SAM-dependent methyltransferase [Deltaproteobacteria bacterium]|nr:class I SAM-dependent methyltransferase [Deltaproteobacteria bacterium]